MIDLRDVANRLEECADDIVKAAPIQLGRGLAQFYSLELGLMADDLRVAWEDAKEQAQELDYGVHQEESCAQTQ